MSTRLDQVGPGSSRPPADDGSGSTTPSPWLPNLLNWLTGLCGSPTGAGKPGPREVVSVIRTCLHADNAAIAVVEDEGKWLRLDVADGDHADWQGMLVPVAGSVSALAMSTGRPVRVDQHTLDTRTDLAARTARIGPSMVVPLLDDDRVAAVFLLGRRVDGPDFTAGELTEFSVAAWAWQALAMNRRIMAHARRLEQTYAELDARLRGEAPADTTGGSTTLVSRVLSVCESSARPAGLVENVRIEGTADVALDQRQLTAVGAWLADALTIADQCGSSRSVTIAVNLPGLFTEELTISVRYTGTAPTAEQAPLLRSMEHEAARCDAATACASSAANAVTLSWTSRP